MSQIGRYTLLNRTSSRGDSDVYEAFDPVGKRTVAIRISKSGAGAGWARGDDGVPVPLVHPNIVRVLETDEAGGQPYIVLEHFAGESLKSLVGGRGVPRADALEILRQIAGALDHTHSLGLVHSALTPDQIKVAPDGLVKLDGCESASGAHGTPRGEALTVNLMALAPEDYCYVAPEIWMGQRYDARADQYSFATVAYYLLTGSLPFESNPALEALKQVLFDAPRLTAPNLPQPLLRALERALSKNPISRFESCRDFFNAVSAALAAPIAPAADSGATRYIPQPAMQSAPAGSFSRGGSASNTKIVAMVAAAALLAVAGAAYLALRENRADSQIKVPTPAQTQPAGQAPAGGAGTPKQAPTPKATPPSRPATRRPAAANKKQPDTPSGATQPTSTSPSPAAEPSLAPSPSLDAAPRKRMQPVEPKQTK